MSSFQSKLYCWREFYSETHAHNLRACNNAWFYPLSSVLLTLKVIESIVNCVLTNQISAFNMKVKTNQCWIWLSRKLSFIGFFVEKRISVKKVGSQLSIDFKIINKINYIDAWSHASKLTSINIKFWSYILAVVFIFCGFFIRVITNDAIVYMFF